MYICQAAEAVALRVTWSTAHRPFVGRLDSTSSVTTVAIFTEAGDTTRLDWISDRVPIPMAPSKHRN